MNIWLDTTEKMPIQKAKRLGLLAGITTNPQLIVQAKRLLKDILKDLLDEQEGPVAVQVVASQASEMVQQGEKLYNFSNRLIVKVPVNEQGLEAIHLLSCQGIPTIATVVFHPRQALVAALAGAKYVAPYISRLEQAGEDPWERLQQMQCLFKQYNLETKILGASLKDVEQVLKCAEIGINSVTIKESVLEQLIGEHPLTTERVNYFTTEWEKSALSFGTI
jgi:transaldolase